MGYLSKLKDLFVSETQADQMRIKTAGASLRIVCCEKKDEALNNATLQKVRDQKADLYVISEIPESLLSRTASWDAAFDLAEQISKKTGAAVIFGKETCLDASYGEGAFERGLVYKNAQAKIDEADEALYLQHTETKVSPFDFEEFAEEALDGFPLIDFKGHVLGLVSGGDFRHAMFSRMYHGFADMMITVPDSINADEAYLFGRARAIENYCYNFVISDTPLAFNPNGKRLQGRKTEGLVIFDTAEDMGGFEAEAPLQKMESRMGELEIPAGRVEEWLKQAEKIQDTLYVYEAKERHYVFCLLEEEDIYFPEVALKNMYSEKLRAYANRRYVLVSRYKSLREKDYRNLVLPVLRVRAMENCCAVILESERQNICLQGGRMQSDSETFKICPDCTLGPEDREIEAKRQKGYRHLITLADAHDHDHAHDHTHCHDHTR